MKFKNVSTKFTENEYVIKFNRQIALYWISLSCLAFNSIILQANIILLITYIYYIENNVLPLVYWFNNHNIFIALFTQAKLNIEQYSAPYYQSKRAHSIIIAHRDKQMHSNTRIFYPPTPRACGCLVLHLCKWAEEILIISWVVVEGSVLFA